MAKPRILLRSIFYNLGKIRTDLNGFVESLGYELVKSETRDKSDTSDALICDIIVCLIGGHLDTEITVENNYGITIDELKRAIEKGVRVFIFVDRKVLAEFSTYQLNKGNKAIKYRHADDVSIYDFIEKLYYLPKIHSIIEFSSSADIIENLRSQWADLFQGYIQEQKRISEIKVLKEMKSISGNLVQLVNFLIEDWKSKDQAINNMLLPTHPIFRRFAEVTDTNYRVFFANREELKIWLQARMFEPVNGDSMDKDSIYEWQNPKTKKYIKLTKDIFYTDGHLKVYSDNEWSDEWLQALDLAKNKKVVKDKEQS
jgi:hypothetical protein